MTLTELQTEVYNLTGRSDRVAETLSAIRAATLKAHQSDYYPKDIFETAVDFGAYSYVQAMDYRSLVPRWRALKYLRKYDPTTMIPGTMLEVIVPENIFDKYKMQKSDICYMAGAYLQVNSSAQDRYYLLGCYVNPDVTVTGYSSWVALDHPYYIVFDAAATVFKAIGKDDEAAAYRLLVQEQLAMLRASNLTATGF